MTKLSRRQEINRVLIVTLIANVAVAAAKLIVGLLSRSLAMVADGFHSSLDATANVIGLTASVIASRPPDEEHPYGHRRFETLASMTIGGMLLLAGWEVVKSSVKRLLEGGSPDIGIASFVAMAATLVVNIVVSSYEWRAGKRLNSEILLADSVNTRSDILVSSTVLLSLAAVRLGWIWLDAITALIVVGIIGLAAWRIVQRAVDVLVDHAALDPDLVKEIVNKVAGVQQVVRVRSRGPDDEIHLDLDVRVAAPTTAEHTAAIAREMRMQLRERFEGLTDIQVHFLPERDGPPDYALVARADADAMGLGVHEVIPTRTETGLILDMHVEVAPEQSVAEAHKLVSHFEERLKQSIPELKRVVTHIEPAHVCEGIPNHPEETTHILAQEALRIAQQVYPDNHWHDLDIRRETDGGYALSMHCHVEEDMPLEEAHRMAETVETQVRAALPALHRVTIHTEPPD